MKNKVIVDNECQTNKRNVLLTYIAIFVILVSILIALMLNVQYRLNSSIDENNKLKQQISLLNNVKNEQDNNPLDTIELSLNRVKSFNYEQVKINIYTFNGPQAEDFYLIKQADNPYSNWGKDGSYNYSVVLSKHPFYGDDSYADIVGNKLIALNASTNTVTIFKINNQYQQYKSFTPIDTIQLPENFSGVPYSVKCSGSTRCNLLTAWHSQGGCSGFLSLDNYTFSDITCGEGDGQ